VCKTNIIRLIIAISLILKGNRGRRGRRRKKKKNMKIKLTEEIEYAETDTLYLLWPI
jgi:hypothetical protein